MIVNVNYFQFLSTTNTLKQGIQNSAYDLFAFGNPQDPNDTLPENTYYANRNFQSFRYQGFKQDNPNEAILFSTYTLMEVENVIYSGNWFQKSGNIEVNLKANECYISDNLSRKTNLTIGDTIQISSNQVSITRFEIVGVTNSFFGMETINLLEDQGLMVLSFDETILPIFQPFTVANYGYLFLKSIGSAPFAIAFSSQSNHWYTAKLPIGYMGNVYNNQLPSQIDEINTILNPQTESFLFILSLLILVVLQTNVFFNQDNLKTYLNLYHLTLKQVLVNKFCQDFMLTLFTLFGLSISIGFYSLFYQLGFSLFIHYLLIIFSIILCLNTTNMGWFFFQTKKKGLYY